MVEDEEIKEVTDRNYWEKRGTAKTVALADELVSLISSFTTGYELKYNKFYIGLAKEGHPNNFAIFRPKNSTK